MSHFSFFSLIIARGTIPFNMVALPIFRSAHFFKFLFSCGRKRSENINTPRRGHLSLQWTRAKKNNIQTKWNWDESEKKCKRIPYAQRTTRVVHTRSRKLTRAAREVSHSWMSLSFVDVIVFVVPALPHTANAFRTHFRCFLVQFISNIHKWKIKLA